MTEHLTPRELEVLQAYRETGSLKAAAAACGMSEHTARNHLANARLRCGAEKTWQLFRLLEAPGQLELMR